MLKVAIIIFSVFAGCCSNALFLELLVKEDPGGGSLRTFSQFVFISLLGFSFTSKFGTAKPKVQRSAYLPLVVMFFIVSLVNNYVFDWNIPVPLHMIFRSGSLIANMIMGILILKKVYKIDKYLSVLMITGGIILCTIVSGSNVEKSVGKSSKLAEEISDREIFIQWSIGISLLTVALFISAGMGIFQEVLYKKHGKYPYESLYYTHLLSLPWFLFTASNLWEHLWIAIESRLINIPILNISMPCVIAYMIGDTLTQYVCISSVYQLTSECSSLTVTLVITLRKFISLLFSIFYFQNPFTLYHWIGTILVFGGTAIFTELPQKFSAAEKTATSQTKIKKKLN